MHRLTLLLASAVLVSGQDWKLGTVQLAGVAGVNAMADRDRAVQPSAGFGVAVGISRYLAVAGSYGYNRLASINETVCMPDICFQVSGGAAIHEWVGGLRVNASNPSRAMPYLSALAGIAQIRASGRAMDITISVSEFKPAFGIGAGVDLRIGGPVILTLDFRAISPSEMRWYGRAGVGIGIRR